MTLPRILVALWLMVVGSSFATLAQAPSKASLRPEVEEFIGQLVSRHNFDESELRRILSRQKPNEGVLKAINAPATAKPWHEFRPIFVTPTRISGGLEFWKQNEELLRRAR